MRRNNILLLVDEAVACCLLRLFVDVSEELINPRFCAPGQFFVPLDTKVQLDDSKYEDGDARV